MSPFTRRIIGLLIILSIWGCQKKADFKKEGDRILVSIEQAEIEGVDEIKWRTGLMKGKVVSKGMSFKVNLPQLDKKLVQEMAKKFGANAWILRVRRRSLMKNDMVGQLYVPIILPGTDSKFKSRMRPVKSVSFRVYYGAAANSRFERLECPPFNHNLRLKGMKLKDKKEKKWITSSPHHRRRVLSKLSKFSYSPVKLNAGNSLEGSYEIEMGFFNSKNETIVSTLQTISGRVEVDAEKEIQLPQCENYKIPPPKSPDEREDNKVDQFNFGG